MNTKNHRIGLIVSCIYDSYQNSIITGITEEVKKHNHSLYCYAGSGLKDTRIRTRHRNFIYNLISTETIDSIIILTGSVGAYVGIDGTLNFLRNFASVPIVSVGINLPGIPSIVVDNGSGMKDVVNHLIREHDRKKIAFIKGPDTNEEAVMRFNAYKESLEQNNLPYDPQLVCPGDFLPTSGPAAIKTLVDERKVTFDALIGVDDCTILNAITPLKKRGYHIPDDIIIAGFDDIEESQYHSPPLTTVRQPLYELGKESVGVVLSMLNGEQVDDCKTLDTQMVIRKSCGCSLTSVFKTSSQIAAVTERKTTHTAPAADEIKKEIEVEFNKMGLLDYNYDFIAPDIDRLIESGLKGTDEKSKYDFLRLLEMVVEKTNDHDVLTVSWSTITTIIIGVLKSHAANEEHKAFFETLWNEAFEIISFIMVKYQAQKRIMSESKNTNIQILTNSLLLSFEKKDIKRVMDDHLPDLHINSCFCTLYESYDKKKKQPGKARLMFYVDPDKRFNYSTRKFFDPHLLVPGGFDKDTVYQCIILPMIYENEILGNIIYELNNYDWVMYETLTSQITSTIKGSQLVNKVKNHAKELSITVEEQTQELVVANKKLKDLSYKDQLSGLRNRRFLMDVILPEAQNMLNDFLHEKNDNNRRSKVGNDYLAVLLMDLDHFKHVNDTYGHLSGDEILKQLSSIFNHIVRTNDFVVRWGGEEFLFILRNFNPDYLIGMAEKLRISVANHQFKTTDNILLHKTCSIGCLTYPLDIPGYSDMDFLSAISLADKALFFAKRHGRNRAIGLRPVTIQKYGLDIQELIQNNTDDVLFEEILELFDCKTGETQIFS